MIFSREKRLLAKLRAGDVDFRSSVADDPKTPATVLDALAEDESTDVRLAVASNRSTRDDTLYALGHDSEKSVRAMALTRVLEANGFASATRAMEESGAASPQLLAVVAEDLASYSSELRALCGTPYDWYDNNAPAARVDVLFELAKVRNPVTRTGVAKSKDATPAILGSLAVDVEDAVRAAVAANTATTTDVLTRLARDPAAAVRKAVVANGNAPDELLLHLASDADAAVRLAVALGAGPVTLFSVATWEKYARETPVPALLALAEDAEPKVRMAAASSPRLPLNALGTLARDPDKAVRGHVADVIVLGYGELLPSDRFRLNRDDNDRHLVPSDALGPLARSPHPEIRRAVAEHPLVPAAVLAELLDDKQVFDWDDVDDDENRAEDTLMPYSVLHERSWESHADWQRLARVSNPEARRVLARTSETPDDVLELLSADDVTSVRECVLSNHNLPAAILRRLVEDPSESVAERASVVLQARTRQLKDGLGLFVDAPSPEVRVAVARDEAAQGDWLDVLAKDSDARVRAAVATNKNTPLDSLVRLAADGDSTVIDAIVRQIASSSPPPATYEALSVSPSAKVRAAVAVNRQLPDETLKSLIQDPDEAVRRAAATNGWHFGATMIANFAGDDFRKQHGIGQESVPRLVELAEDGALGSESLHSLAQSPFDEVRASVAANPAATASSLANLARDKKVVVRAAVAKHPNAMAEVLTVLSRDEAAEVRRGVAVNPNTPAAVVAALDRDPDDEVALAIALHPTVTPESLDALIEVHSEPRVSRTTQVLQSNLGGGSDTILDAFVPWRNSLREYLARSDNRWQQGVRQAVAANPKTTVATLTKLARQQDTVAVVAANPATPSEILAQLIQSTDVLVREAAGEHPNTTEGALGVLALDREDGVRLRVASNRHTARSTLEILVNDFSSRVKDAARETLSAPPAGP